MSTLRDSSYLQQTLVVFQLLSDSLWMSTSMHEESILNKASQIAGSIVHREVTYLAGSQTVGTKYRSGGHL